MSILPVQLQIASDLHLETPLISPSYTTFNIDVQANNLCLLGDVGLVKDEGLFVFLRTTLERSRGTRIFYVIGNHEAYQISHEIAVQRLREFEMEARADYGGRFILLDKDRYDLDASTTILGCTLWSSISAEQASEAQLRLTDFNEARGIRQWSLEDHLMRHNQDIEWLDAQVQELQEKEPHRQIAILTHHSPTTDDRAVDPKHRNSILSTCFATDLSDRLCWTCPMVKLWAFGHTHYNCSFRDEVTGKIVLANQKGYQQLGAAQKLRKIRSVWVEVDAAEWRIVTLPNRKRSHNELKSEQGNGKREAGISKQNTTDNSYNPKVKRTLFQRAIARFDALRQTKKASSE